MIGQYWVFRVASLRREPKRLRPIVVLPFVKELGTDVVVQEPVNLLRLGGGFFFKRVLGVAESCLKQYVSWKGAKVGG